jgi:hypothetical protein
MKSLEQEKEAAQKAAEETGCTFDAYYWKGWLEMTYHNMYERLQSFNLVCKNCGSVAHPGLESKDMESCFLCEKAEKEAKKVKELMEVINI